MATLKDLAQRTGYAPATISRILNADPTLVVSPEARRAVLEEAGRLNYSQTRSRRGRTPKTVLRIGMVEALNPEQQLDDPYYLYLSNHVRQGCAERKFACVPLECRGDHVSAPEEGALAGIVAVGRFSTAQIEAMAAISPNVVFLDCAPFDGRFDAVVPGYELGVRLAMEHLEQLGHRDIGFVGPEYNVDDCCRRAPEIRRQLFIKRTQGHGLLLDCPMKAGATQEAWTEYLKAGGQLPTAVLCANEENAVGTLNALSAHGIRVPEDVSVVSFNDTPRSSFVNPGLTSVSIPVREMADTALRMVQERAVLPGKEPVRTIPLKVIAPLSFVARQSSGKCRRGLKEPDGGKKHGLL